jgi:hypothetical protein
MKQKKKLRPWNEPYWPLAPVATQGDALSLLGQTLLNGGVSPTQGSYASKLTSAGIDPAQEAGT